MLFTFSVATTYVLTNIDGLFTFMALAATGRKVTAIGGFLLAQVIVVGAALVLGAGATRLAPSDLGLLGIVPVALGLREILRNRRGNEQPISDAPPPGSLIGALTLFLALSSDTFILMAAFFADTHPTLEHLVLFGALVAVAVLLGVGIGLNRLIKPSPNTEKFFERLAPLVMIAGGIYILMDTQTGGLR